MSDQVRLSRRRLLGAVVAVGVAGAGAGAGTMAAFSDSETSSSNAVESGTLTLSFGSGGSFAFDTALAPTGTTTDSVTLVSGGTEPGSLDVDVNYAESDASGNGDDVTAEEMAQNLEVATLAYGGTDLRGQVGGSPPTLDDLATNDRTSGEATGNDLTDLADPGSGTDFTVGLRLKDVGNRFQGDGVAVTFDFHLNQHDSQ